MGCGSSSNAMVSSSVSWDSDLIAGRVPKRAGHPAQSKSIGYDFGMRIKARGTHQSLFVATSRSRNEKVSIAEFNLKSYPQPLVVDEVLILAKLAHPGVVKLMEVFVSAEQIHCVTQYVDPMRLKNFVDIDAGKTQLALSEAQFIAKALLDAVVHCHEQRVILRCLTADNIMVRKNSGAEANKTPFDVKIANLSLATTEVYTPKGALNSLSDHPLFEWSSVPFMPPEVVFSHPFSTALDMWFFGVLLFLMLSGSLPFDQKDDESLVNAIKTASFNFSKSDVWKSAPEEVKTAIMSLIVVEPEQRKSATDLRKQHWFA